MTPVELGRGALDTARTHSDWPQLTLDADFRYFFQILKAGNFCLACSNKAIFPDSSLGAVNMGLKDWREKGSGPCSILRCLCEESGQAGTPTVVQWCLFSSVED